MEPEVAPSRCVVVYDGDCPFCRRQMAWVRSRDHRKRLEFVASQDPELTRRFPQLEKEDLDSGLRLIEPGGSVSAGADAVYEIVRRLPRWRRLAWVYRVPGLRALAARLYGRIAARRHTLSRPSSG